MNWLRLLSIVLGTLLYYATMRYFTVSDYFWHMIDASLVLACSGPLFTWLHMRRSTRKDLVGEAHSYRYTIVWQGVLIVALLAHLGYFWATRDAPPIDTFVKKLLLVLWLLPLIIALSTAIGMETSLHANGHGRFGEPQRVLKSGLAWSLAGVLLAILLNVNYLAVEHNHVSDWSYLKVTSVSKTTQAMVNDLDKKLEVYAFLTKDNEVYPFVNEYLASLAAVSQHITVQVLDKDLSPVRAEKFRVHRNGNLVLTQVPANATQDQREDQQATPPYKKIYLGTELRIARAKLRGLDAWFQKALLQLLADPRKVYFSRGHGEFTWDYQRDPRRSLRVVRALLKKQNFRLRTLGLDKGSGRAWPDDVGLVIIAGPTEAFLKEEVAALRTYLAAGGKALVLLDIERATGLATTAFDTYPLLNFLQDEVGLQFKAEVLANDRSYVVATKSMTDRWFLVSNNFTAHEAVATMADYDEQVAVLFFQSGYFAVQGGNGEWQTQAAMKALPNTFVDKNKNFTFDKGSETRAAFDICAAAEWQEKGGRIFACADATLAADLLMQAAGNKLLFVDSLQWLMGDKYRGAPASEEDEKIIHSRDEDLIVFYSTIIAMPLLLLLAGILATRRRQVRS